MNVSRTYRFWIIVGLFAGMLMAAGCTADVETASEPMDVADALSADTAGFARADRPHAFEFPRDHGPHPEFRTEWWYYTGNLFDAANRRYGYQFTIFRTSLRPPADDAEHEASWTTDQLYMAHFALSDPGQEGFVSEERFSRGAAGLAGAQAYPYRVWLEDWSASAVAAEFEHQHLYATTGNVILDLEIEALKPIVLHGEDGLDRKSSVPGDASYYYTLTRWETRGTIQIGDSKVEVFGTSWLDREWSTSVLGDDIRGWDWFALQFDDGRDMMYYQLRDADGNPTDFSGGVIIDSEGSRRSFTHQQGELEATGSWRSPLGGTYPSGWTLTVPDFDLHLSIDPVVLDQEVDATVRYWEGAVDVEGTLYGTRIRGVGYVELTGYAEAARAQLSRH